MVAAQRLRLLLVAVAAVAGCGSPHPVADTSAAAVTPATELPGLLATVADVNSLMGIGTLMAQPPISEMNDDRHLLPNLNCLGVWQLDEAAIYGERGGENWEAVRHQTMQDRGGDQWQHLVVQSVAAYPSAQAAAGFFVDSGRRWENCVDHHVNITLNDRALPSWFSGQLDRTDNRLTMPIARGAGAQSRSCEHVLNVRGNVVIEVQACGPSASDVGRAAGIADRIESQLTA